MYVSYCIRIIYSDFINFVLSQKYSSQVILYKTFCRNNGTRKSVIISHLRHDFNSQDNSPTIAVKKIHQMITPKKQKYNSH
jgi:hypothetical protein